jgi:hypothetical protein
MLICHTGDEQQVYWWLQFRDIASPMTCTRYGLLCIPHHQCMRRRHLDMEGSCQIYWEVSRMLKLLTVEELACFEMLHGANFLTS